VYPEPQLDAVAAQRVAECEAERLRLAGQHMARALDDDGLAAETGDDLGELDAGRPGAEHEQAARDGCHAGRLTGTPDAVKLAQSWDGRHDRIGACRHDNMVRGVADAVDVDHAGAVQPARSPQQADIPGGQPALLTGVAVIRHHEVPPRQRGRDVDLGRCADVPRVVHCLARP
jgi:hypothetical protein